MTPTIVLNAPASCKLMQEEIFGPVLPIVEYGETADAIAYVNERPRPLALYWFGNDARKQDMVLRHTISGGVAVNDCLWQIAQEEQPFGGVGESGIGAYHGETGFRTFSKEKPVFRQARLNGTGLLAPPYGKTFNRMMRLLRVIT